MLQIVKPDEIDSFIRKSYYGGRVEISQLGLVEKRLYYNDFTSLYPAMGCYDLPYGEPEYINFHNNSTLPDSFFGFIKCLVKTKCNKRRPIHGDKSLNKLCFREHHKWEEMTLFSEEVRYGLKIDMYDYQFIEGYNFKKAPIMKEYLKNALRKKQLQKLKENQQWLKPGKSRTAFPFCMQALCNDNPYHSSCMI